MNESKLGEELIERLQRAAPADVLDLVVELHSSPPMVPEGATRDGRISATRDAFGAAAAPVEQAIRSAGGEVVDSAWINQTLRARVPAGAVAELAGQPAVRLLDLPRRITPDAG